MPAVTTVTTVGTTLTRAKRKKLQRFARKSVDFVLSSPFTRSNCVKLGLKKLQKGGVKTVQGLYYGYWREMAQNILRVHISAKPRVWRI
jgi:hypothetical protein